jgi:hypothetical protein
VAEPGLARSGATSVLCAGTDRRRHPGGSEMLDVLMLVLGLAGFGLMLGYAAICTRL